MKKIFFTIVFLACATTNYAQEQPPTPPPAPEVVMTPPAPPIPPKYQKIKALKTAYITNALNLSQQEAEKFWPIYNELEKKRIVLRKKVKLLRKTALRNFDQLTELEAKKIVAKNIALEQQVLQEKKVMLKKITVLLSAKKTIQLQKAEHDFNRKLLRKMKGKTQ